MKDLLMLSPIWLSALTGILVLAMDLLAGRKGSRGFLAYVTTVGFAVTGVAAMTYWTGDAMEAPFLSGILAFDGFGLFFALLILVAGAASALFSIHYLPEHDSECGEYYALLSFSVCGALVFLTATDLITLFLGLEVMSLAVYIMAALKQSSPTSTEAGMKYFILGGLASAFLLFGVAFLYGATGSLNLVEIGRYFLANDPTRDYLFPQLALVLMITALGFKVAAVPFHMWTPDVYDGAPTPVTVFMAGAIKAVGFAVLARVLLTVYQNPAFLEMPVSVPGILLVLAVLTMFVGNVLGLVQDNVKRILAYSSIAHAGYLLLGVYATSESAGATVLNSGVPFYMLTYVFATIGAFGIVALLGSRGEEDMSLDNVAGLGKRHPVLAALMLICLLSLAGVPPLAGFMGKFYLFREILAIDTDGNLPWVIIAVLNSFIAVYYYLRIAVYMYFREPAGTPVTAIRSMPGYVCAGLAALISIWVGLFPARYIAASEEACKTSTLVVASEGNTARPTR
ncbi:MAG: NADH-quinone oxidoreductase subunit N [Deltaproteobacteria bacterium]|nr:NADH-quinone oxidoreductase subunit N [Deltaproteobacteria bacterium]